MAVALASQVIGHAGAAIAYKTSTDGLATTGNTAPCGAGLGLVVKNGSGASVTVTVTIPAGKTFDGLPIAGTVSNGARSLNVAAGAEAVIPLVASTYAAEDTGLATFGVSATASISVAAVAISA